ncbi:MAG: NAD(P)H-hydrate epimerase [Elusimicrobia bacterium GWA2_69_24]|nr:MAG: NAD(P)H-hydrate epimerase [Elusimicrobia bacterium GWA2_69_24]HBL17301.1 NAD(P)H-hydrate epimerase [Elusimicrobiota bacterium]
MKAPIPEEYQGLPVVTPRRMAELDRAATAEFGLPVLQLMENAGRAVAQETARFLAALSPKPMGDRLVTVCCGRGNNGGDGLVVARHLKEMGCEVMVFISPPKRDRRHSDEVQRNLTLATEAGVSMHEASEELVELDIRLRSSEVVVDALLGTGTTGKPAGITHKMIQCIMKSGKPVIAVDLPSGLNPETGYHSGVIITAALTCALGLPKRGLLAAAAKRFVGDVRVLDIGYPAPLLARARGGNR